MLPTLSLSWKRLLAFVLLSGAFYGALAQAWERGLATWLIDVVTVPPAAWLARLVCGDPDIAARGAHLQSPSASLNVLFGCEGTDVLLVLAAALLVTPVRWTYRWAGVLAGMAVVFLVNQLRLLALFVALRSPGGWFGALHGLVAPLVVVVAVTAYYFFWLRWSQPPGGVDAAIH
jgi:exosortase/archaeosortase family protein